jgi:hypothetical protein
MSLAHDDVLGELELRFRSEADDSEGHSLPRKPPSSVGTEMLMLNSSGPVRLIL